MDGKIGGQRDRATGSAKGPNNHVVAIEDRRVLQLTLVGIAKRFLGGARQRGVSADGQEANTTGHARAIPGDRKNGPRRHGGRTAAPSLNLHAPRSFEAQRPRVVCRSPMPWLTEPAPEPSDNSSEVGRKC